MIYKRYWTSIFTICLIGLSLFCGNASGRSSVSRSMYDQARRLLDNKQYAQAVALMEKSIELDEASHDYGAAYWSAWLLARQKAEWFSENQRLLRYEQAEQFIKKRDHNSYTWLKIDVHNYIQLLCEKETIYAQQGRMGEAFITYNRALDVAKNNWGDMSDTNILCARSDIDLNVYINLLMDQAEHQQRTGQLALSEKTFIKARIILDQYILKTKKAVMSKGRLLNNYSVLLGLMGRDDESREVMEQALHLKQNKNSRLITESNKIYDASRVNGPSEELFDKLMSKAELLRENGQEYYALNIQRSAASVLYNMKEIERAEDLFKDIIKKAKEHNYRTIAAKGYFWRAKARGVNDIKGAENDFLSALKLVRQQGAKPEEFRLYQAYAKFLLREKRINESLVIIREAVRLNRFMGMVHLRPELLSVQALILLRTGDKTGADKVWDEIDSLLLDIDTLSDYRRLNVMMAKLTYLAETDRLDKLAIVSAKVKSFIDNSLLTEYQKKIYYEFNPDLIEHVEAVLLPSSAHTFLQPVYSSTRCQPSVPTETWFWLLNYSLSSQSGILKLTGMGKVVWNVDLPSMVEVSVSGNGGSNQLYSSSRELTLAPQSSLGICVIHENPPSNYPATISVSWTADKELTSTWNVISDADHFDTQYTFHTHFVQQNIFYSVPLYHIIGAKDTLNHIVNFRVRSQTVCRVEIYDAEKMSLLAVDADGNGSYSDVGDIISQDNDRDGFPDISTSPLPIVVYVYPVDGVLYEKSLDIVIETMNNGKWVPMGSSRILDIDGQ